MLIRAAPAAQSNKGKKKQKEKPITSAQRKLLALLQLHPGLDASRLTLLSRIPNINKTELLLQSLVKRGLLRWSPGFRPKNVVYFVTPYGESKL